MRSSLDNQKDPPRNPAISLIVVDELIQHKAISPDASRSGAKVVALYAFFTKRGEILVSRNYVSYYKIA